MTAVRGTVTTSAASPDQHGDVGEHAGQQLALLVGQQAAHQQRARILGHARIERLDLALEHLAGIGVDGELDRLADPQLADLLLGHREIDADGIERLQRHQRHARRHVLALLHLADAERGR